MTNFNLASGGGFFFLDASSEFIWVDGDVDLDLFFGYESGNERCGTRWILRLCYCSSFAFCFFFCLGRWD